MKYPFYHLNQKQRDQATAMFLDAGLADGYFYEVTKEGNVISRKKKTCQKHLIRPDSFDCVDCYNDEVILDASFAEAVAIAAEEWKIKWPNHCKACGGWGGNNSSQSVPYGSTTASFDVFDSCEATSDPSICHRCGEKGLSEDGDGPCQYCNWDYNDGVPSL